MYTQDPTYQEGFRTIALKLGAASRNLVQQAGTMTTMQIDTHKNPINTRSVNEFSS